MKSTPQPKQYPVKRHQNSSSPGWDTTCLQGSDCEFLHEYTDGGLCPVVINDVLSGSDLIHQEKSRSFRIIGKLGRGSYSIVWLGRETTSGEYLALKVLRLEHSTLDNPEMRILRKLEKLETAFFHTHTLTKARFLCLGLKPLGCTLREREVDAPDDIPSLTTLVKTLLFKVLDFHQKRICHGDISVSNVSFGVHPEAFTDENLSKTFEDDRKSSVVLQGISNLSTQPSRPVNLPEYVICHYGGALKTNARDMSLVDIIDFGKGFETPSKKNVFGTKNYCAPELDRNGENIATARSDLWSLGCVLAYVPTDLHFFTFTDQAQYLAADCKTQVSMIESHLSNIKDGQYRHLLAQLIQSLVRADPAKRDPEEAKRILKQLEELAKTLHDLY